MLRAVDLELRFDHQAASLQRTPVMERLLASVHVASEPRAFFFTMATFKASTALEPLRKVHKLVDLIEVYLWRPRCAQLMRVVAPLRTHNEHRPQVLTNAFI